MLNEAINVIVDRNTELEDEVKSKDRELTEVIRNNSPKLDTNATEVNEYKQITFSKGSKRSEYRKQECLNEWKVLKKTT